jgi:hypothetical protein
MSAHFFRNFALTIGQPAEHQKALNLAIKDEIAALQWVQHGLPDLRGAHRGQLYA